MAPEFTSSLVHFLGVEKTALGREPARGKALSAFEADSERGGLVN